MNISDSALRREERAIFDLRELYEQHGYKKYKMSKFEEYDLYQENKSFLPTQQIITFTDLRGKLMALKPDVTLSIAKNAPSLPTEPEKVYYNENVYRTPKGSSEYREIMQVGLEYLGDVDLYSQCEVVSLAFRSLQRLSENRLMVVSHLGFVAGLLKQCSLPMGSEEKLLGYIGHKNGHEIQRLCSALGISDTLCADLLALTSLYGEFEETLAKAEKIIRNDDMGYAISQLREIWTVLKNECASSECMLDFSVINDLSYYNGLIFQGFIDGVPRAILSGGRYDKLMERLSKKTGALGFAVYVDQLEQCLSDSNLYDFDVLLMYGAETDPVELSTAVKMLTESGKRVRAQKTKSEKHRYKQLMRLGDRGLEVLETND